MGIIDTELSEEWINWGHYEFAPSEVSEIAYPEVYTGYAFTGIIQEGKFVIVPLEFTVGQVDPRDSNPIVVDNNISPCTISKIVVGIAPLTGSSVAYLQLDSDNPRFFYRSWPVVCSDPETMKEELLGTHVEVDILILESLDQIDYETTPHHVFLKHE